MNTVQIVRRFYRSWWKRPFWLLGVVVLGVVAGRLALTPYVSKVLRAQLDQRAGKDVVTFQDLDIYLFPPAFVLKNVAIHPAGGESLDIARVELHASSWRELRQPLPTVRVRLERPALRLMAGSHQLEQIARALPPARVQVTTIAGGSVGNGAAPAGRPVVERVSGEIEGLATGSEVGLVRWQFWGDGSLLGADPVHVVIGGEPNGRWKATFAGREAAPTDPATPPVALSFDGHASGTPTEIHGLTHVSWSTIEPPIALSRDRSRALDDRWPATHLRLIELRRVGDVAQIEDAPGGAVDVIVEGPGTVEGEAPTNAATLGVSLVVGMVRLGNRAVVTPPPGLAALSNGDTTESSDTDEAASYDSH